MEWVNITAKTLPEAIDRALDNLGVDEAEADIEVLEEPKQGLFGRLRGNARVRARVKPKATRPKVERGRGRKRSDSRGGRSGSGDRSRGGGNKTKARSDESRGEGKGRSGGGGDRPKKGGGNNKGGNEGRGSGGRGGSSGSSGSGSGGSGSRGGRNQQKQKHDDAPVEEASMEEVSAHLETFLSGLTDAFGFEGPVSVTSDDEEGLTVSVEGRHGLMVGPKGRTLDAIQELARVSAQRTTPSGIRIKVDVGGYREMRREALRKFAVEAAEDALGDGRERSLDPMSSADRKVVHDALSEMADIETRSAGTDPRRRVVVVPLTQASDDDATDDADAGSGDEPDTEQSMGGESDSVNGAGDTDDTATDTGDTDDTEAVEG